MLVLSRNPGESIVISTAQGDIVVQVSSVLVAGQETYARVKLAVSAPRDMLITREPR